MVTAGLRRDGRVRSILLIGTAAIAWSSVAQAQDATNPGSIGGGSANAAPPAGVQPTPESAAPAATVSEANAPAAAATPAAPENTEQVTGVEDIVVTAQKREQNLQKVPISITALSAVALRANRIQTVADLSAAAPNLTVREGAGGNQSPVFTLRGILGGNSAPGTDKGVSIYLDGVYIQNQSGAIFEFADIERIEILKGPQGTLFGRNATGGAVSIITKNPTGEFSGHQDFTYGNRDTFRSKTHLNLPQFGPISASLTYLHSERHGDVRNLGAGTLWDYGPATGSKYGVEKSPKYLGSTNTNAVQAALKFDFHPDLDLIYKFDYTHDNYTPTAQGISDLPPGFIRAEYDASVNPKTPITTKRPKAVNNSFTTPGFVTNWGHNFTARYRFSDVFSIKNIFSVRKSKSRNAFQLDGLGGLTNQPVAFAPGVVLQPGVAIPFGPGGNPTLASFNRNAPFVFVTNNAFNNERQLSDEVQLNVTTDAFNLTAGFLHFHDHIATAGYAGTFNSSITAVLDGQNTSQPRTAFVIPGNPGYQPAVVTTNSDAFFVQPEIHLTDQIDLVGGVRVTYDDKKGIEYLPDQILSGGTAARPAIAPIRYKAHKTTYLLGVNYRVTDNILTYAKYATGFVSGGTLATLVFRPETAKSIEGGIKADLFDRRFRSNLAVFHVKYTALQYDTSGMLTGVPSTAAFSQAVVSSADAKAYGFEWENTIVPVNGLTLTANLGYTHFRFDQSTVAAGLAFVSGAPGYKEFHRPKFTGTLAAQYEGPELVSGGHLLARVDGNFKSKELMTSDITRGTGPTAQTDPSFIAANTAPFSWIVNGRLGLANVDLGGIKVDIGAWGRNIFDNRNITQTVGLGLVTSVIYERARSYGVDLSFSF